MATKPVRQKAAPKPEANKKSSDKKLSSKAKKQINDDEDETARVNDIPEVRGNKKALKNKDDDSLDEINADIDGMTDEVNKAEDDENWDPDFDEFDLPKSIPGKTGAGKKAPKEDDDDFSIDEEFKDLFNKKSSRYDDPEDDY